MSNVLTAEQRAQKKAEIEKKRKFRKKLVTSVVAAAVIVILLVIAFFALIRVKSYKVKTKGTLPYTSAQIFENCGIYNGDHLFLINYEKAEEHLSEALPYCTDVKITRRLPFGITISVTEDVPAYTVIMSDGLFAVTDRDMKVLEVTGALPENCIIVQGYSDLLTYKIGARLSFTSKSGSEDKIGEALSLVSQAVDDCGLDSIEMINVEDGKDIYLIYDDRIIIRVGDASDVEKKIALAKKALDEENTLSSEQYGQLDVSVTKKAIFDPLDYKDMQELIDYDDYLALALENSEKVEVAEPTGEMNGEEAVGDAVSFDDETTDEETSEEDSTEEETGAETDGSDE